MGTESVETLLEQTQAKRLIRLSPKNAKHLLYLNKNELSLVTGLFI